MRTFIYRAYGTRGEFAEGTIFANSERSASDALWAQGLVAFELRPASNERLHWWRGLFAPRNRVRAEELSTFTREFATLNAAEVPLDDALRILASQATSARVKALSSALLAEVLDGSTLSDAMRKWPAVFSIDYVSLVRAGELSGGIGDVVNELANLLERRAKIHAEIQSALVYPIILIFLLIASTTVVIGSLFPTIATIFLDNGRPIPAAINVIIVIESVWPQTIVTFIVLAACISTIAVVVLRKPRSRLAYERLKIYLPVYGSFALKREIARFARTLGTLLKAGVPLLQAATSAREVITNRYVAHGMDRAVDAIREGAALHRALRDETAFPEVSIRMIAIGEEAGKLDRMLMHLAEMFEQQTHRSVDRFMTVLTPALTVAIALFVGGLITTVITAIMNVNDIAFQ